MNRGEEAGGLLLGEANCKTRGVAVSFALPVADLQLSLCQGRDQSALVVLLLLALLLLVYGSTRTEPESKVISKSRN